MSEEASILTHNFGVIAIIIQDVAIFLGVGLTLGGFFQLKKYGEQRTMMSSQHSLAGPLMMLVAGAMLLILPQFMGALLLGFWGNALDYPDPTDSVGSLVHPILLFVRLIGVGSFIRGIILMSRCGGQHSQPGQLGKALIHMFAGILCVHIMETVYLLKEILGMN